MLTKLPERLVAEFAGTAMLLVAVVGSGIMAEKLSGGSLGLALLANALATVAALIVLITALGPVSGAHFNSAVTGVMVARGELPASEGMAYTLAQLIGGVAGVWLAHLMFDLPVIQMAQTARTGLGQFVSEIVATMALIGTILLVRARKPEQVAAMVGLTIGAAYWFTASTSFANPAVTLARSLSDSFAGIRPVDVPAFLTAQMIGAALAGVLLRRA